MRLRSILFFAALCMVLSFVVFPLPRVGGFVSDDWDWISAASRSSRVFPDITANYGGTRVGGSYNPVVSLWVNALYRIFGSNPVPFHAASRVLHALNAVLAAVLCSHVFRVFFSIHRSSLFSLSIGTLFLIWPTHAEAVLWVAAVPHLLATFFVLVSFIAYIAWREYRRRRYLVALFLCGMLAFFSKETAIILPVLLFVGELWLQRHRSKRFSPKYFLNIAGLLCCAVLYLAARWYATGIFFGNYAEHEVIVRPFQWINTIGTFFVEFLSMGALRTPWMHWFWQRPLLSSIVCVVCLAIVGITVIRSRSTALVAWWHIALLALVPFIPLGFNRLSQEGERYTYLPSVFFGIFLGAVVFRYAKRFSLWIFIGLLVAAVPLLQYRTAAWQRAYEVSHAIVSQSADIVSRQDASHVSFFVGLPDTIGGAHVFRNNLSEAIRLSAPEVLSDLVVIPVYTQASLVHSDSSLLDWTRDERGFFGRNKDNEPVVTGYDRRETAYFIYELWNYEYSLFSSDTVRLLFTPQSKKLLAENRVSVFAWDGHSLRDIMHLPMLPPAL